MKLFVKAALDAKCSHTHKLIYRSKSTDDIVVECKSCGKKLN